MTTNAQIKQEKLEMMTLGHSSLQIKKERLEMQHHGSVSSSSMIQTPAPDTPLLYPSITFSNPEPEEPFNCYSRESSPPAPPSSSDFQLEFKKTVLPDMSQPPPHFSRPPPSFPASTLPSLLPPQSSSHRPSSDPRVVNSLRQFLSPALVTPPRFQFPGDQQSMNPSPRTGFYNEEPSPMFSPIRPLPPQTRPQTSSVPRPSAPLPDLSSLFSSSQATSTHDVEIMEKQADESACLRLQCCWRDEHVDTCSRKQILASCEGKRCAWSNLHSPDCPQLSFYCNGKKTGQSEYKWFTPETMKEIKIIPLLVPGGENAIHSNESKSVAMRLRYMRMSTKLNDPRKERQYPMTMEPTPATRIRRSNIRGRSQGEGWADSLFTWSSLESGLRVRSGDNPQCVVESDHESDIEICDD